METLGTRQMRARGGTSTDESPARHPGAGQNTAGKGDGDERGVCVLEGILTDVHLVPTDLLLSRLGRIRYEHRCLVEELVKRRNYGQAVLAPANSRNSVTSDCWISEDLAAIVGYQCKCVQSGGCAPAASRDNAAQLRSPKPSKAASPRDADHECGPQTLSPSGRDGTGVKSKSGGSCGFGSPAGLVSSPLSSQMGGSPQHRLPTAEGRDRFSRGFSVFLDRKRVAEAEAVTSEWPSVSDGVASSGKGGDGGYSCVWERPAKANPQSPVKPLQSPSYFPSLYVSPECRCASPTLVRSSSTFSPGSSSPKGATGEELVRHFDELMARAGSYPYVSPSPLAVSTERRHSAGAVRALTPERSAGDRATSHESRQLFR